MVNYDRPQTDIQLSEKKDVLDGKENVEELKNPTPNIIHT